MISFHLRILGFEIFNLEACRLRRLEMTVADILSQVQGLSGTVSDIAADVERLKAAAQPPEDLQPIADSLSVLSGQLGAIKASAEGG